jgi:hypothetical protein
MPSFILFNVFHPGRIAKGNFIKRIIDARHPGVLLEGPKNGGDGTDSSNERLKAANGQRPRNRRTGTIGK